MTEKTQKSPSRSPESNNSNRRARQAWQKVAKNFNTNTHYLHNKFLNYDNTKMENNTFTTNVSSSRDKLRKQSSSMSAFKFTHGLPIKDSDKDTFSSGITTKLIINPEGNVIVLWLGLIALGFTYFAWSLIARQAFRQLQESFSWGICDYLCDFMFIVDIFIRSATAFLDDGMLVTSFKKVAKRYIRSRYFILDVACLLPVPFSSLGDPLWRLPRLLKFFRAKEFIRRVEWAISFPNVLRVANLVHTLMLLMHWFACFYFMVSETTTINNDGERGWAYPFTANESEWNTLRRKYLHSLYWSCLTLTTIGEKQSPSTDIEYLCTMAAYFLGIFVFATVVGQVGNVITSQNENKQSYEKMMDHAKRFMTMKNIPKSMQQRVLRWYRFSRSRGTLTGDNDVNSLEMVPDSLKTELAIFVNLHTLRKVPIFQLVQPEFLHHLVLKMKSCIYTPGDLVCRYGEVGREMFIVNHGFLEVVSESDVTVARLKTGDFFGEIGVLNLNEGVNKRVASVRSVGYSEVFILSADDLLQAMDYYPEAKQLLLLYGRKRFQETEQRKHSKSNSIVNGKTSQADDTPARKYKTAEMLVSSAFSTMESVFSLPKELHGTNQDRKKGEKTTKIEIDKKEVDRLTKLDNLLQSLNSIVDEHKHNDCASSTTNTIRQQERIIKEKEEEIYRLNADIKLLMNKLEEYREWQSLGRHVSEADGV